jgi:carbohydrate kinase (thermoresistant glucokinase family)
MRYSTISPPRVVVMGVSGCGKSTVSRLLAQHMGVPFIEGDELHPARNVALMSAGIPLTDDDRRDWLAAIAQRLRGPAAHQGAVVACSALRRTYRDVLRQAAPDLALVHLSGEMDLIAQRLGRRAGHYMPATLLQSQLDTLEPPQPDEHALVLDVGLPAPVLAAQAAEFLHRPVVAQAR